MTIVVSNTKRSDVATGFVARPGYDTCRISIKTWDITETQINKRQSVLWIDRTNVVLHFNVLMKPVSHFRVISWTNETLMRWVAESIKFTIDHDKVSWLVYAVFGHFSWVRWSLSCLILETHKHTLNFNWMSIYVYIIDLHMKI